MLWRRRRSRSARPTGAGRIRSVFGDRISRLGEDLLPLGDQSLHSLVVQLTVVIAHTDCRMATGSEEGVHAAVNESGGPDTRSLAFLVTRGGFMYDIDTGRLSHLC